MTAARDAVLAAAIKQAVTAVVAKATDDERWELLAMEIERFREARAVWAKAALTLANLAPLVTPRFVNILRVPWVEDDTVPIRPWLQRRRMEDAAGLPLGSLDLPAPPDHPPKGPTP